MQDYNNATFKEVDGGEIEDDPMDRERPQNVRAALREAEIMDGSGKITSTAYMLSRPLPKPLLKEIILSGGQLRVTMVRDVGTEDTDTFLGLYARYGQHCLPQRSEGYFKLTWEMRHRGTPLELALVSPNKPVAERFTLEEVGIYMEIAGPTPHHVKVYRGFGPYTETYVEAGKRYLLTKNKASDDELIVPLAIKSNYFHSIVQKDSIRLTDPQSYSNSAASYAGQYYRQHVQQAERILANCPGHIIEPGCGAGIVRLFRKECTSGDLYPPSWAPADVKVESIKDTIKRGPEGAVVYMGYLSHFLDSEIMTLLATHPTIWVDAPDIKLGGIQVAPGVHLTGPFPSAWWPDCVPQEKRIKATQFMYSENLLSNYTYAVPEDSEYLNYLRIMRPWMRLIYLPTYVGAVERYGTFGGEPILCADIKSLSRMMVRYPGATYYFCPIGKIISHPDHYGFRLTDGGAHLFYEYRRVFLCSKISLMGAFMRARLPHLEVGDSIVGYDVENTNNEIFFDMSTPQKALKLRVTRRESLDSLAPIMRSNGGIRIHISIGTSESVYPMEGKIEHIHPILRMYFLHGINDKEILTLFSIAGDGLVRSSVVLDKKRYVQLKEYESMVRYKRSYLNQWMAFLEAPPPDLKGEPGTFSSSIPIRMPVGGLAPYAQSTVTGGVNDIFAEAQGGSKKGRVTVVWQEKKSEQDVL